MPITATCRLHAPLKFVLPLAHALWWHAAVECLKRRVSRHVDLDSLCPLELLGRAFLRRLDTYVLLECSRLACIVRRVEVLEVPNLHICNQVVQG